MSRESSEQAGIPTQFVKYRSSFVLGVSVLLLLWTAYFRFGFLDADPAFHLSKSAGIYFDPFSHSGNARSYVLFGDLHPDQWNTYIYSPIYVLLQVVWFTVLGVTIKTMHGYGAMWAMAALVVCWICHRRIGVLAGFLALTFLSLDYLHFQFGRLALLENAVLFFLSMTMLMLLEPLTKTRVFFCGVVSFMMFIFKATTFYLVPGAAAAVVFAAIRLARQEGEYKEAAKLFLWYCVGTILTAVLWLVLFRIPNHEEISRVGVVWWKSVEPPSLRHSLDYLIDDALFSRIGRHDLLPLIMLGALGVTVYRLLCDWRKVSLLMVLCLVGFVVGAIFVGMLRYKPTRFSVPLMPLMFSASAIGLAEFYQSGVIRGTFKRAWAADVSALLALTAMFRMVLYYHPWFKGVISLFQFQLLPGQWDSLLASFITAGIFWSVYRGVARFALKEPFVISKPLRGLLVGIFVLFFAYGNVSATSRWYDDRNYTIKNANRKLSKYGNMVVGGLSVHAAVMETPHRAVRIQHEGWHNSIGNKIFTDLGLTHLLLTDYVGLRHQYFKRFRREMDQLKRLEVFPMAGQAYHLYEIPEKVRSGEMSPEP